ncbi:MAG: hypothetical protein AAF585_00865 [Verrucomicrobiota bacterium]
MQSWITKALDLRKMPPQLARSAAAERAADTEVGSSFWMIDDHEPVEICQLLGEMGFAIQTFIYSETEYRVFAGNCRPISNLNQS